MKMKVSNLFISHMREPVGKERNLKPEILRAKEGFIRVTDEVENGNKTGRTLTTIIFISEGDPRE